jgi:short-subunit dehydrogenase
VLECRKFIREFFVPSKNLSLPSTTPLHPKYFGLIIGASSGIGAALARHLALQGYTLALVSRRTDLLESLCKEINQTSGETRALSYTHDVTNYDQVPDLLRRIVSDLGGLDTVIYSAGVNFPPGLGNYNFDGDRQMLAVNLIGAISWLNPIAEMFQSAKRGQIVGISSVAGDRGRVGNPGYNTSKAGLATYLEALRNRLTRYGVNVLTVKPGFVETDMLKAAQGPTPFKISAEKAANDIYKAMRARKQQIYTPWFWTWIMLAIRNTPSFIFRRMNF